MNSTNDISPPKQGAGKKNALDKIGGLFKKSVSPEHPTSSRLSPSPHGRARAQSHSHSHSHSHSRSPSRPKTLSPRRSSPSKPPSAGPGASAIAGRSGIASISPPVHLHPNRLPSADNLRSYVGASSHYYYSGKDMHQAPSGLSDPFSSMPTSNSASVTTASAIRTPEREGARGRERERQRQRQRQIEGDGYGDGYFAPESFSRVRENQDGMGLTRFISAGHETGLGSVASHGLRQTQSHPGNINMPPGSVAASLSPSRVQTRPHASTVSYPVGVSPHNHLHQQQQQQHQYQYQYQYQYRSGSPQTLHRQNHTPTQRDGRRRPNTPGQSHSHSHSQSQSHSLLPPPSFSLFPTTTPFPETQKTQSQSQTAPEMLTSRSRSKPPERSYAQDLHLRSRSPKEWAYTPLLGPDVYDPATELGTFRTAAVMKRTSRIGDQERPWKLSIPGLEGENAGDDGDDGDGDDGGEKGGRRRRRPRLRHSVSHGGEMSVNTEADMDLDMGIKTERSTEMARENEELYTPVYTPTHAPAPRHQHETRPCAHTLANASANAKTGTRPTTASILLELETLGAELQEGITVASSENDNENPSQNEEEERLPTYEEDIRAHYGALTRVQREYYCSKGDDGLSSTLPLPLPLPLSVPLSSSSSAGEGAGASAHAIPVSGAVSVPVPAVRLDSMSESKSKSMAGLLGNEKGESKTSPGVHPDPNIRDRPVQTRAEEEEAMDSEVVMSSTAYPGQEWRPVGYEEWNDDD